MTLFNIIRGPGLGHIGKGTKEVNSFSTFNPGGPSEYTEEVKAVYTTKSGVIETHLANMHTIAADHDAVQNSRLFLFAWQVAAQP